MLMILLWAALLVYSSLSLYFGRAEQKRADALERMLDEERAKTDGWARTLCDACKAKQERVT